MKLRRNKIVVGLIGALMAASIPAVARSWDGPKVRVIINGQSGTAAQTKALIQAEGGTWVRDLSVLDGGIADIPSGGIEPLRKAGWVRSVVVEQSAGTLSSFPANTLKPSTIPSSDKIADLDDVAFATNARNAKWSGKHGSGVDIAVIDSGVTPVEGMQSWRLRHIDVRTGQLTAGNDALYDRVGHGTFMACVISCSPWSSIGTGMAYASNIVSVNVTNGSGAASLSEVLLAIDAVIANKSKDGLNIRVMLMALGFDSKTPAGSLVSIAAERAVKNGIVVVASAGNGGQSLWRLDSPAASPAVLAVGASQLGIVTSPGDEWTTGFSSVSTSRPPDVIAPGQSVRSARVPGSFIDEVFPAGRVGEHSFLGSGTSQAAAVVAGLAATLIAERPTLKPEEVKAIFKASATKINGLPEWAGGAGAVNYEMARWTPVPGGFNPAWTPTTPIVWGNYDPIAFSDMEAGDLDGTKWTGTKWTGTKWTGTKWTLAG